MSLEHAEWSSEKWDFLELHAPKQAEAGQELGVFEPDVHEMQRAVHQSRCTEMAVSVRSES
jgi:hypothetical protein